mmetsp:Transcript_68348/g.222269  ORF Transcript_68348/g.222269 Transcript_68348/m.222269 type:complete len:290 (+) Transcript_68348:191-1060(+)
MMAPSSPSRRPTSSCCNWHSRPLPLPLARLQSPHRQVARPAAAVLLLGARARGAPAQQLPRPGCRHTWGRATRCCRVLTRSSRRSSRDVDPSATLWAIAWTTAKSTPWPWRGGSRRPLGSRRWCAHCLSRGYSSSVTCCTIAGTAGLLVPSNSERVSRSCCRRLVKDWASIGCCRRMPSRNGREEKRLSARSFGLGMLGGCSRPCSPRASRPCFSRLCRTFRSKRPALSRTSCCARSSCGGSRASSRRTSPASAAPEVLPARARPATCAALGCATLNAIGTGSRARWCG